MLRRPGSTRPLRPDAFPEGHAYRDSGCALHPACLACPESTCVDDLPRSTLSRQLRARTRDILILRFAGFSVASLMALSGLSKRTIMRARHCYPSPN